MKVAVFSNHAYDKASLDEVNKTFKHELVYFESSLGKDTIALAAGFPAVCLFVNDHLNAASLATLAKGGTKLVALRAAGYNNVDLKAAAAEKITVVRVPAYSPYAVAEYTIGLMLALNRNIVRAVNRVREDNFALEGLMGQDMHGKTVGVIGTGRIGSLVAQTCKLGFGCEVLAYDVFPNAEVTKMGVEYVDLKVLLAKSAVVFLHCPMTPETKHIINAESLALTKPGFLLLNTGRGALVDTEALIDALDSGQLGGLAMDVYEQEGPLYFEDRSDEVVKDAVFQRLLTYPNVLITGHQAFFTKEAVSAIAKTTLQNIADFEAGHSDPKVVVKAA